MFYYANKRRRNKKIILIVSIAVVVIACVVLGIVFSDTIAGWFKSGPKASAAPTASAEATPTPIPEPQKPIEETGLTVLERFGVPEGFKRVSTESGSFGEFLRQYALKAYGTVPMFQDGTENTDASTVGVLDQALISKNQQSPDTIMWLYAEYLFEKGAYEEISFDFLVTPVFHFDYATWLTGQRLFVEGSKVEWVMPEDGKAEEPSMTSLRAYMIYVMMYANATSLKGQLSSATTDSLAVGDILIDGHAIIVMDVCVNEETGEKRFICAEGNTPATEMYILQNPETESVWLTLEEDGTFVKGDKVYSADAVRRFS